MNQNFQDVMRAQELASRPFHELNGEEKDFLRSLIPEQVNPCEDCSMCCTAPAIGPNDAVSPLTAPKPACQACEYAERGGGCRVYNARPEVCQDYYCLYSLGMSENFPKDCGVAWTIQPVEEMRGKFVVTGHCLDTEEVLSQERNLEDIARFLVEIKPMCVILRDDKHGYQFALFEGGKIYSRMGDVDQNDPLKASVLPETERMSPIAIQIDVEKIKSHSCAKK